MCGYTFYFLRSDASVPAFDFADCRDEAAAMHVAEQFLKKHATAEEVEVFNGEQVIGVASRTETRVGKALRRMTLHADANARALRA